MTPWALRWAARALRAGGLVAYPTEAVWGLGCNPADPVTVFELLELKQRHPEKGLILVAADLAQLRPWIAPLSKEARTKVLGSWPGPVTWLVPAAPACPYWLTGAHETLAVRVTAHPVAAALCRAWGGALVSTSANPAARRPARSALAVRRYFGERLDAILAGPTGGAARPSAIRDLASGRVLRQS